MSEDNIESTESTDTNLEDLFVDVVGAAHKDIYEKLEQASKLIDEAVAISEKYGVPFSSGISFLGNDYIPESFRDKWKDLDESFALEKADIYSEYASFSYAGWVHSAVCW